MSFTAGFVVLTAQPDGTWRDDYDGVIHTDPVEAHRAEHEAEADLGEGNVQLCRVLPLEDHQTVNADSVRRYLDTAMSNWRKTLVVSTGVQADMARHHYSALQLVRQALLGDHKELDTASV